MIDIETQIGKFLVKSISSSAEMHEAQRLRYQVFQVEMIGHADSGGVDQDEFDDSCDHLAIFDTKTSQMIATCRLNSSLRSQKFYSEKEFHCQNLLAKPEVKIELGRVCVHKDFRRGVVIMLLWRALASYMRATQAQILFGCGSVATLDPRAAFNIYRYLQKTGKVRDSLCISPTEEFQSQEFNQLLMGDHRELSEAESQEAASLLPPLCRSYFDMGCYVPGPPAFDRDFRCIDFLTVLEVNDLDPKLRKKMLGDF